MFGVALMKVTVERNVFRRLLIGGRKKPLKFDGRTCKKRDTIEVYEDVEWEEEEEEEGSLRRGTKWNLLKKRTQEELRLKRKSERKV